MKYERNMEITSLFFSPFFFLSGKSDFTTNSVQFRSKKTANGKFYFIFLNFMLYNLQVSKSLNVLEPTDSL
jgi:hypothetical protein